MSSGRKAAEPAIAVRGISKSFRIPHERQDTLREHFLHPLKRTSFEVNTVLKDVNFEIAKGERFGVVGRNGSGKTTLLKTIAGIYRADAGNVVVNGMLSPFIELGVGFNMELSARDNVIINGTLLGLSRRDLEERFDEIIAFAELERFVDQRLKNYSSGMQVRLAYSVAIQAPFDVLLVDEVLAVGDARFQQKCVRTFDEFQEAGKTLILVSHSPQAVRDYCDRAILLEGGEVVSIGPAGEVVDLYLEHEGISADAADLQAVRRMQIDDRVSPL
jgi:ABC-type polysaccharide/polyol phosphate transport system ATPase subunit